jgi:hypothetical protein
MKLNHARQISSTDRRHYLGKKMTIVCYFGCGYAIIEVSQSDIKLEFFNQRSNLTGKIVESSECRPGQGQEKVRRQNNPQTAASRNKERFPRADAKEFG